MLSLSDSEQWQKTENYLKANNERFLEGKQQNNFVTSNFVVATFSHENLGVKVYLENLPYLNKDCLRDMIEINI